MSTPKKPPLYSDFDGTAVEKLDIKNPRDWIRNSIKYPLAPMEGYDEFLQGTRQGGLRFEGFVTRRPNIFPRRLATSRSVRRYLPGWEVAAIHAGSEDKKAAFIIDAALIENGAVGFADDQPHKIGASLLKAAGQSYGRANIVLGAVALPETDERIEKLVRFATDELGAQAVERTTPTGDIAINSGNLRLQVVSLLPYGLEAGQQFAQQVIEASS